MTPILIQIINCVLAVAAFMLVASACLVGMWLLFDADAEHAPSKFDGKGRGE